MNINDWADCDCKIHKVCMWAGEGLCSPCTINKIGKNEFDRRYKETRADDGSWAGPFVTLEVIKNAQTN